MLGKKVYRNGPKYRYWDATRGAIIHYQEGRSQSDGKLATGLAKMSAEKGASQLLSTIAIYMCDENL